MKSNFKIPYVIWSLILLLSLTAQAQPNRSYIEVFVSPEHPDWTYKLGERADFNIKVLKNGLPVSNAVISYSYGLEQLPAMKSGEVKLTGESVTIKGTTLKDPGFLRCHASLEYGGKTYEGWGTAGFEPEKIAPTVDLPTDFTEFWNQAKAELSQLPIDPKVTLIPEESSGSVNVYHVSLQNIRQGGSWQGASRFYGILSVPKKVGKYPAILRVPGAGARRYYGDNRAGEGVIVFSVGIHGVPVNMDPDVYRDLMNGAISGYWINKLSSKDEYYYKRVYMGCVRAIDFIFTLPEFDGNNLAVTGGSQGGALSIVTAGLDERINYLAAFYPALSDVTGYLHNRAGGWPHMFKNYDQKTNPAWLEVAPYYDVVNFAKSVKVKGWYSWGYNDNVCPPTSMYAAYNSISAPKELHIFEETAHWTFPEQQEMVFQWLMEQLRSNE